MPLYVHFGAGNIGRALAGPVFRNAGYDVLFVDASASLVDAIRRRRGYRVVVKDDLPPGAADVLEVSGVDAVTVHDVEAIRDAVAHADLLGTAVGAGPLPQVLKTLVPGLLERGGRPVSILLCENLLGAAALGRAVLRESLPDGFRLDEKVGLVETSIGKMVPLMPPEARRRDPLEVWAEAYNTIIADRSGFVGPLPGCREGLELKDNFQAYVERKLYVHNLGHATCGCHGYLRGHTLIADAIADPLVLRETRAVMMASARALARRYEREFTEGALAVHVEDLLRRFGNRALGDTVFRVGRDLMRKLAPGDRFVGGLRLVLAEGGDAKPVCRALRAALRFQATDEHGRHDPADRKFREQVARLGVDEVLRTHCGLTDVERTVVWSVDKVTDEGSSRHEHV